MNIQQAIAKAVEKQDLDASEMSNVMHQIMTGGATEAQIGGFLIAMRMKGETIDEVTAAATVMRDLATPVSCQNPGIIDIVGTGGDSSGTFNVSTASCAVAAAAGASVAKHGNRSVSSRSGGADLLEQAGVNIQLNPEQVARCVDEIGVGFMLAQLHHSAMRFAIGPRREMATRTIFNILGPLTNPAGVKRQVIGVFKADLVEPIANVLMQMGSEHALVVHSDDGMDEFSLSAGSLVAELKAGQISRYHVTPEDFGLQRVDLSAVQVDGPEQSLAKIQAALSGQDQAACEMVALNAGAGIYVAGLVDSHHEGVKLALDKMQNGEALKKFQQWIQFSQAVVA